MPSTRMKISRWSAAVIGFAVTVLTMLLASAALIMRIGPGRAGRMPMDDGHDRVLRSEARPRWWAAALPGAVALIGSGFVAAPAPAAGGETSAAGTAAAAGPNILFCIADDWGWPAGE